MGRDGRNDEEEEDVVGRCAGVSPGVVPLFCCFFYVSICVVVLLLLLLFLSLFV